MLIVKDFNALKKSLKKNTAGFRKVRIGLLGDNATQLLSAALRATGIDRELDLEIWEADFNQVERQVFDPASELYAFRPEIVLIYRSSHRLLQKYNQMDPAAYKHLADQELQLIAGLNDCISGQCGAKTLYYNYPEINDGVFGSFALKTPDAFLFQLRRLNYELMNYAAADTNFYLLELSSLQNQSGKSAFFETSVYINAEMTISIRLLPQVAGITVDMVAALAGRFKKCLVLDLDNTLWGGIIGDDGLENIQLGALGIGKAFTEFQYWLKKLKNRGLLLAVCSKNTASVAKEPFEKHPDMVLRLADIAVFVANWESKVDNITYIQQVLNIGFDSMVFLDDNPFERNIVRERLPEVCVPELPEDPAEFLEFLYPLNLFETVSYSGEDRERTSHYQVSAERSKVRQQFSSESDFLASLHMISRVEPFTKFNIPRAAQLTQRSNQFNLRTVRYSEADLERLCLDNDVHTFTFGLQDKFGDNGLISVVILREQPQNILFIDTWLMSCRVLKRGIENFVLNTLAEFAAARGVRYLRGEYIPTAKNGMVMDHFEHLGFKADGDFWTLETGTYRSQPTFIQQHDH